MSRRPNPWAMREKVHQRDVLFNGRRLVPCHYRCGATLTRDTATLDHITPTVRGGGNESANLVLACYDCNQRRGSMSYMGFLRLIGQAPQDATLTSEIARLMPPAPCGSR